MKSASLPILNNAIQKAWDVIPPLWPLKSIIARNPLAYFENINFNKALVKADAYFRRAAIPPEMHIVNRETIKWCAAFFDEGQATIKMPYKDYSLYGAWRKLVVFDDALFMNNKDAKNIVLSLSDDPLEALYQCLELLELNEEFYEEALLFQLTTLPGWAGYIKYNDYWRNLPGVQCGVDYLVVRLALIVVLFPGLKQYLHTDTATSMPINEKALIGIKKCEHAYQEWLVSSICKNDPAPIISPDVENYDAQFVFCIDVRSEQFRRAIESSGQYETFGAAGFFGIPLGCYNDEVSSPIALCPVLLKPLHIIKQQDISWSSSFAAKQNKKALILLIKRTYQSLKYSFATPFPLIEFMGPIFGLATFLKTTFPHVAKTIKQQFSSEIPAQDATLDGIEQAGIAIDQQCSYAEEFLQLIGLSNNFAPIVVFSGHGSSSENNINASSLDCGACGAHSGELNAQVLAAILNNKLVRVNLSYKGIVIPDNTFFLAALHNTTTDDITFYDTHITDQAVITKIDAIKKNMTHAKKKNNIGRFQAMGLGSQSKYAVEKIRTRSADWAQTFPELALCGNASFIVAPRNLTKHISLNGRSFLHSYNYSTDQNGTLLEKILLAPMIVAQWINAQYLFSSIDIVAYGSGSKITQNIIGKFGVMQGNASDLMHGLPMQSLYSSSAKLYYQPIRLHVLIYARHDTVTSIIKRHPLLQKLFSNEWIFLFVQNPLDQKTYRLTSDLSWVCID